MADERNSAKAPADERNLPKAPASEVNYDNLGYNEDEQEMHKVYRSELKGKELIMVKRKYGDVEIEVPYHEAPVSMGFRSSYYPEPEPGTIELEPGVTYERDHACTLSNGDIIYLDIYRPTGETNVPIIAVYTPYGKRHYHGLGIVPGLHQAIGVPKGGISKMAVFEGPDPSFWVRQGYAVANIDAAGHGYNTSDHNSVWHSEEGKKGAEVIEWLSAREWCNGKVGMLGNSALAMGQWWIAAERPPHLACIAPWEGCSDIYREACCTGGIPYPFFVQMISDGYRGPGLFEDDGAAITMYPLWNEYWEDRRAKVENINIPVYCTVCWQHDYHPRGTLVAWRKMKTKKKWMRIHRVYEWEDLNNPVNMQDLKLFFDRYLKNIYNAWESTPPVRVDVMDAYRFDYVNARPEDDWPIPRTQYTKFYLNASTMTMHSEPVQGESKVAYDALTGEANFDIEVTETTEITGYLKLRLWVEAEGNNDIDFYVWVQKIGLDGELLPTYIFQSDPFPGAQGFMRVSHRELDEKESTEWAPVFKHTREQLLSPGEIVPVDIEIWPHGKIWHPGEKIRVNVSGRYQRDESWLILGPESDRNKGKHIIHTGGKYESYLLAPVIPPKYKVGDYVYNR